MSGLGRFFVRLSPDALEAARQLAIVAASSAPMAAAIAAMTQTLLSQLKLIVVDERWVIDGTEVQLIVWKSGEVRALLWDGEVWETFEMPKSWG